MSRPFVDLPQARALTALLSLAIGCGDAGAGLSEGESETSESGEAELSAGTSESAGEASSDEGGSGSAGGSVVQLELDAVQYAIDWETPGPVAGEGLAFDLVTDLGYEVAIDEAFLTTRGMTLLSCDGGDALAAPLSAGLEFEPRSDGAQTDPTSVYHGYVEDLSAPAEAEFGVQSFDATTTCGVHFVLGQAPATALNMPNEPDMLSRSLWLTGRFRGPGADAWTDFSIDINHADGLITAWDEAEVTLSGAGSVARVVIVRDLSRAFDGLELDEATQMDLDIGVLHNLAVTARVRVEDPV